MLLVEVGRKIIFLDIDGVLNTVVSRASKRHWGLCRDAVERLNRLVAQSGAEVVLSSAWRSTLTTERMQEILDEAGFRGRLIDRTPRRTEHDPAVYRRLRGFDAHDNRNWPRGYEIQQWLDAQPDVTGIVILDDRGDMEHLRPWLVRTRFKTGLLDEHIEAGLARLDEAGPPVGHAVEARAQPAKRDATSGPGERRIVFLDINGVLNDFEWRRKQVGGARINPATVVHLNQIVSRARAEVVISSSWRNVYGVDEVESMLVDAGYAFELIGRTPIRNEHDDAVFERIAGRRPKAGEHWPRGYEIQQWIDGESNIGGIVILDDRTDMAPLDAHHIQIDRRSGLSEAHVVEALERLERPLRGARRSRKSKPKSTRPKSGTSEKSAGRAVIFLDIDGVLNPRTPGSSSGNWREIAPACVEQLNEIQGRLASTGFCGQLIGRTPLRREYDPERTRGGRQPRCQEIQLWLDAHPEVGRFVILDERPMQHLREHALSISPESGLEEDDAYMAIKRLKV